MRLSRRGVLLLPLLAACSVPTAGPLVIAAGEPGGFYVEFADLLSARLADAGVPAGVLSTGGSVDNIAHVGAGTAALGLALSDIAVDAVRAGQPLVALGRVYENYMQLVVRADSPVTGVPGLAGRPVSLGATGSGAAVFGDRLLAVADVTADVRRMPLRDAADALGRGDVDALLWSGGVPTPALAGLAERTPVRLVPLAEHLPALQARFGSVYGPARVPAGAYGPAAPVPTVGVANLLVARSGLPVVVAGAVVRVLVDRAAGLVPSAALGTQYLDQDSLIGTGAVPLHPGATAAYRELHG